MYSTFTDVCTHIYEICFKAKNDLDSAAIMPRKIAKKSMLHQITYQLTEKKKWNSLTVLLFV